jgi:hypothetical protein
LPENITRVFSAIVFAKRAKTYKFLHESRMDIIQQNDFRQQQVAEQGVVDLAVVAKQLCYFVTLATYAQAVAACSNLVLQKRDLEDPCPCSF